MHSVTDAPAQRSAARFGRDVALLWQAALGRDLIGAYLIGSLAHGGFSQRYSDIDIALITEAGLSPETLDRLRSEAASLSAEWGSRLSVFWTDHCFALGRFPPLDRIDYLDHAVVLRERQRVQPVRPALEEIRRYLADAPFAKWTGEARRFAHADILEPKDRKAYLRALLYPARLCYSWMTGRMGSNDEAVAFLHERRPARLDLNLIASALQCRQADADPDGLFLERTALLTQVEACAAVLTDRRADGSEFLRD
jgi:predicted nucleotidyltransferase